MLRRGTLSGRNFTQLNLAFREDRFRFADCHFSLILRSCCGLLTNHSFKVCHLNVHINIWLYFQIVWRRIPEDRKVVLTELFWLILLIICREPPPLINSIEVADAYIHSWVRAWDRRQIDIDKISTAHMFSWFYLCLFLKQLESSRHFQTFKLWNPIFCLKIPLMYDI